MKKSLRLLLVLVLTACILFSVSVAVAENFTISLDVEFEKNLMFSKYDVDVFLDSVKVGTYDHGKDFSVTIQCSEGNHTIWFYEHNDKSQSGSIQLNVNSNSRVKCHIECKRNRVEVSKIEINRQASAGDSLVTRGTEIIDELGDTKITDDGLSVTLLDYSESRGDSFMPPDDGNIYLVMDLLIENNSSKNVSISSLACFNGYCDSYTVDHSFGAAMAEKNSLDGTIAPGKKMKGQIAFEVPKNWQEFELHVNPAIWGEELEFVFHKKQ